MKRESQLFLYQINLSNGKYDWLVESRCELNLIMLCFLTWPFLAVPWAGFLGRIRKFIHFLYIWSWIPFGSIWFGERKSLSFWCRHQSTIFGQRSRNSWGFFISTASAQHWFGANVSRHCRCVTAWAYGWKINRTIISREVICPIFLKPYVTLLLWWCFKYFIVFF